MRLRQHSLTSICTWKIMSVLFFDCIILIFIILRISLETYCVRLKHFCDEFLRNFMCSQAKTFLTSLMKYVQIQEALVAALQISVFRNLWTVWCMFPHFQHPSLHELQQCITEAVSLVDQDVSRQIYTELDCHWGIVG